MRAYKLKKCKRVHGLHFAPDGRRLLVVGGAQADLIDCAVWLDLATGSAAGRIDQLAVCYAVNRKLSRVVVGGAHELDEGFPVQWNTLPKMGDWQPFLDTSREPAELREFDHVFGLALDWSGKRLAVGHGRVHERRRTDRWEHEVTVLRYEADELVERIAVTEGAAALAFNRDGTRLAVSGGPEGDPAVTVFAQPSDGPMFVYKPPGTRTRCLLYLTDGRLVVANARNVYVLPPDGGEPQLVLGGHAGQVNAVAASPDGRRLLTASHDGAIRVWDAATGAAGPAFDWKVGPVTALAFAPDGLTCAAAGEKGQVVLWDADG
jgi:WD40 repeat protein